MKESINREVFINALASVIPAAAKNDVRYYLNGVCLLFRKNAVIFQATDGHRAARVTVTQAVAADSIDKEILVTLDEVKTLISRFRTDKAETVDLSVQVPKGGHTEHLKVETAKQAYSAELHDGKYPDVDRIIPSGKDLKGETVGLNAKYLSDIVKIAKPFGIDGFEFFPSGGTNSVKLEASRKDLLIQYVIMPMRLK